MSLIFYWQRFAMTIFLWGFKFCNVKVFLMNNLGWEQFRRKIKTLKKINYDKTLKDRIFLKIICCDERILRKKNYDENSKIKIVRKLKDSNCDKTQKLKLWQSFKT